MRPNEFAIFERALEEGVDAGWRRAHKHTDTPDAAHLRECIERAVLDAVCEVFDFEPRLEDEHGVD